MNHRGIVFPITAQSLQPRWQTERQMPEGDRMRQVVDRKDVQRMVAEGAQLVDVLPPREYENEHLKGAVSIPLETLNASTAAKLDRDRPIIVYCLSLIHISEPTR